MTTHSGGSSWIPAIMMAPMKRLRHPSRVTTSMNPSTEQEMASATGTPGKSGIAARHLRVMAHQSAGPVAGRFVLTFVSFQEEVFVAAAIMPRASSMVKVFGRCTGGNSLKVSANLSASPQAAYMR